MNILQRLTQTGNIHLALALIRIWTGAMMLYHGYMKMSNPYDFIANTVVTKLGMPEFLGWAAIFSELLGGLLLIIGLFTRPAALFITITMGVAVFNFHLHDEWKKKEFALAYLLPSLAFMVAGGGMYSIDERLSKRS